MASVEGRAKSDLRRAPPRWDRPAPGARLARHRHSEAHLVLVVAGDYDEAGDTGRRRVKAGSVLVQKRFYAHADLIGAKGATLLCLPLAAVERAPDAGVIDCVDEVVRAAETDAGEAVAMALAALAPTAAEMRDWPDALAAAIREDADLKLAQWAQSHGISPETVSRGFARAFAVTPARYRADARALRALNAFASVRGLSAIAAESGFADQAHMTRELKRLTGAAPGAWRGKQIQAAPGAPSGADPGSEHRLALGAGFIRPQSARNKR